MHEEHGKALEQPKLSGESLRDGDRVQLTIDGVTTSCVFRDVDAINFNPNLNTEARYVIDMQSSVVIKAEGGERVVTNQDGVTKERIALPGQMIIRKVNEQGETEDPYIYGNENDTVEEQERKFKRDYLVKDGSQNLYRKRVFFRAVFVREPTAIHPSWDKDELMGTPANGMIAEGGYTISPESLRKFYRVLSLEELLHRSGKDPE